MQLSLQKHVKKDCIYYKMLKYGSLAEYEEDDYTAIQNQYSIQIRKTTRDEIFQKRRHFTPSNKEPDCDNTDDEHSNLRISFDYDHIIEDRIKGSYSFYSEQFSSEDLDQLIQELLDGTTKQKHHAIIGIRVILTKGCFATIQKVIDAGLIKTLLQIAEQTDWPQMQLQSTWTLTNIASGTTDQCRAVVENGGIPIFVNNLRCRKEIAMQSVWALGNISSESIQFRDLMIQSNAIHLICDFLGDDPDQKRVNHCCWTLSNLCRGQPLPKYNKIVSAIQTVCLFIGSGILNERFDAFGDCLWAISYHCQGMKKQEGPIFSSRILEKIIPLLTTSGVRGHIYPILRIIGNVSSGNEACTQQLLDKNVLASLCELLYSKVSKFRRQAVWILSNITASNYQHNMQVLNYSQLFQKMIDMFANQPSDEVLKQLCFVFSNMAFMNKTANIGLDLCFIQKGIIDGYFSFLQEQNCDSKLLQIVLSCLYQIFVDSERWKGQEKNSAVAAYVCSTGKVELIENLQYGDEGLYFHVNRILQNFFETEDPLNKGCL